MSAARIDHDHAVEQLHELVARHRIAAARTVLAQALPQYPDSKILLQYDAWVDWLDDKLDRALETVERIISIDPTDFDARFLLSKIQGEQGRYVDAERTVLELLRENPEDASLYAHYGRIMLQTFNVEKAQSLAREALRREPGNSDALNVDVLCAFISASGDQQRERLQRLLREYPDQAESIVRVVQALIDNGKTREAYELTRELVLLNPANEGLVELAADLRRSSHWSMLPLWPMRKWGWAGSIGIWLVVLVLLRTEVLKATPLAGHEGTIAIAFLVYVVYSWVWPPMLGRLLR